MVYRDWLGSLPESLEGSATAEAVSRLDGARLSRKDEEFLARIRNALKEVGASDEEIDKATPSLTTAIFVRRKATRLNDFLLMFLGGLSLTLIFGPLLLISTYRETLEFAHQENVTRFTMLVVAIFALVVIWRWFIKPNILRTPISKLYREVLFALLFTTYIIYMGIKLWNDRVFYIKETSIWDIVIISLLSVWIFSFFNLLINWLALRLERMFAVLRPDCALIISLCQAFLAVRNEALWRDQDYRNRIAGHLAASADAIERFMPRGIAEEAGPSSIPVVRQRFKEAAIPLRRRIVWLATPGQLTRTDLEGELRQAVIAASLGELARLEEVPDGTETLQLERRPWWAVVTDLCRGIAWALIPLGLVQLGSALQFPLLSDPDQQAAAQKAAYIWLALTVLRWLSPGNFKETIDAAGTLLGRSKPKGAE